MRFSCREIRLLLEESALALEHDILTYRCLGFLYVMACPLFLEIVYARFAQMRFESVGSGMFNLGVGYEEKSALCNL